jgi:hypothetical protein
MRTRLSGGVAGVAGETRRPYADTRVSVNPAGSLLRRWKPLGFPVPPSDDAPLAYCAFRAVQSLRCP